jgi:hypothetical protein
MYVQYGKRSRGYNMSYKSPLASTTDFGIVQVGTGITVTNGVISGSTGLLNYGFVTSSIDQANPVAGDINIVTFDAISPSNGVSLAAGGTEITVVNAGVYTKLFTIIVRKLLVVPVGSQYGYATMVWTYQDQHSRYN